MPIRATGAAVLLGALVVACSSGSGAGGGSNSLPPRPVPSQDPRVTVPPTSAPVTGEVPSAVIDAIRQRLAEDAPGIDAGAATVVKAEAVDWTDGSLGCPERGVLYTQAIVPGYHIVLTLEGRDYDYRAAVSGEIRRCETPGPLGT